MSKPQSYTKKPVTIQAIEWTGTNLEQVLDFTGRGGQHYLAVDYTLGIEILTLEGTYQATVGDMIIKGVHGGFYPCEAAIFEAMYTKG